MTTLEGISKKGWFFTSPAGDVIDAKFLFGQNKIISSVHPSPLSSRYNCKGTSMSFFGHNQFNKVNNYLENMNIVSI